MVFIGKIHQFKVKTSRKVPIKNILINPNDIADFQEKVSVLTNIPPD